MKYLVGKVADINIKDDDDKVSTFTHEDKAIKLLKVLDFVLSRFHSYLIYNFFFTKLDWKTSSGQKFREVTSANELCVEGT